MDASLSTAVLALITVPIVSTAIMYMQGNRRSKQVDQKLDSIHSLVNSQLTEAVERFRAAHQTIEGLKVTIEELRALLLRLAPNDPRVRDLESKEPDG